MVAGRYNEAVVAGGAWGAHGARSFGERFRLAIRWRNECCSAQQLPVWQIDLDLLRTQVARLHTRKIGMAPGPTNRHGEGSVVNHVVQLWTPPTPGFVHADAGFAASTQAEEACLR